MGLITRVIPGPVKQLARRWLARRAFERKLAKATPILILQMGKVGSLSVHTSLQRFYAGAVVHAHHFAPDHPDPQVGRLFRWAMHEEQPLNVISLIREPIGRNVSAFFQNFERETGTPFAESKYSVAELRSLFISRFDHDLPLRWFDEHIQANFGIDVYAKEFPRIGWQTYERANVRLLVVRSEITDVAKVDAIHGFLGIEPFELRNTNLGETKDYSATYRAFNQDFTLPPDLSDRMHASRYYRHFYGIATSEFV